MASETYELDVQGVSGQERNSVVMHFQSDNVTANETFTNGQSLVTSWDTNIRDLFLACCPSSYYIDRISARRAHPKPSAVPHLQYDAGTKQGLTTGAITGNQICPCIFLVPPLGVKSGGRIFMPGVDDAGVLLNAYQAGYLTVINNLMVAMLANFGVSGVHWQLVVYSRKLLTSSHVMSYTLSPRIGFQKRRRSPV